MKKLSVILLVLSGIFVNYLNAEKIHFVDLTRNWILKNQNESITLPIAQLPSGVYTAVSNLYGNITDGKNDIDLRWIANENWTYICQFEVEFDEARSVNLTLYGVDTISTIRLNDVIIGKTENMFINYTFSVGGYLQQHNVLQIELMSPIRAAQFYAESLHARNITTPPNCGDIDERNECYRNMLRKMQSSFGTEETFAAPSMGLWQEIVLEYYDLAILRYVDIAAKKNATHWTLDMRIFLSTDLRQDYYANLMFIAAELLDTPVVVTTKLSYTSSMIEMQVPIEAHKIELWWPNGYGRQKLYPFQFIADCSYISNESKVWERTKSEKFLQFGFRTIELIEDLDEFGRSFYFKVNEKPIYIKGANYLPTHILPELSNDPERIRHLLHSARGAHMNMIRVWGGGYYESEHFYNLADIFGLLVWQDMTFTEATYPVTDDFVDTVSLEAQQNAKRIAYHPSLALITTNDEIEWYLTKNRTEFGLDLARLEEEYKQLFRGTIKYELNVISRNTFNPRPGPMISTPSRGIEQSKNDIGLLAQDPGYGDIHFQDDEKDAWDPDIYPRARFVSEIGFQSLPSLASWNLAHEIPNNATISNLMKHRQRKPKNFEPLLRLMEKHLPIVWTNWEENVDAFIYFSQVIQAMAAKTSTELYRSQRIGNRTMGILYWHLNDVWIAPTASMMDFYGNHKMVYYWSEKFLAPTAISALYDAQNKMFNITLVRDNHWEYDERTLYEVAINTYSWSTLFPRKTLTRHTTIGSKIAQQIYIALDKILVDGFNELNCFLEFAMNEPNLQTQDKVLLSNTFFYFTGSLANAEGIKDPQLTFDINDGFCTNNLVSSASFNTISYSLTIRIKAPAIFVYIEIFHPDVPNYTLSNNGFTQVDPVKTIQLEITNKANCPQITVDNIKIMTMNQYILTNIYSVKINDDDSDGDGDGEGDGDGDDHNSKTPKPTN